MTGRYLLHTPLESRLGERRFHANWRKFVSLCQSLDRDGLGYGVQFNLAGSDPHVVIMASGTPKPRRRPAARVITLPPPMPAQRCRERRLEVEWFLPENRERRNNQITYWRTRSGRYAELNAMAEEELRAELEYWRELELLSGQRQHFKPGLTDETVYADDEVAA
jgi:hypothetical protein